MTKISLRCNITDAVNLIFWNRFIGIIWYESAYPLEYGISFDPPVVTPMQFACQIYLAFISATASVGYLFIFLLMQPKSYQTLKSWFTFANYRKMEVKLFRISKPFEAMNSPNQTTIINNEDLFISEFIRESQMNPSEFFHTSRGTEQFNMLSDNLLGQIIDNPKVVIQKPAEVQSPMSRSTFGIESEMSIL
jgi:hypothetical protein